MIVTREDSDGRDRAASVRIQLEKKVIRGRLYATGPLLCEQQRVTRTVRESGIA